VQQIYGHGTRGPKKPTDTAAPAPEYWFIPAIFYDVKQEAALEGITDLLNGYAKMFFNICQILGLVIPHAATLW
jgi:hypothetical protein